MAVTADSLRSYLHLQPDNEEKLEEYLAAAKSKAAAAGIPDFKNNALYDLFIKSLAAMYYENRSMELDAAKVQPIINSFVLELRYAKEDSAEGE